MEKFFTINEGSQLYEDYWNWRNNIKSNNEIVSAFLKEHDIETHLYCPGKDFLGIVPTERDKEKFGNQLRTGETNEGLRFFKKNSTIGKAWKEHGEKLKFLHKPSPSWYNRFVVGRSSSRLFDYNGILYCSIEAEDIDVSDNSAFTEMKGSEFYKIMEEISDDKD